VPQSQSALSLKYVRCPVTATVNGQPLNPTGDVVQLAFMAPGALPASGDWKTATWETADSTHWAIILVGPGGTVPTLTPGAWTVWVKVTDSPEIPAEPVDTLTIF